MVGAKRFTFKKQEVLWKEAEMKDYEKASVSAKSPSWEAKPRRDRPVKTVTGSYQTEKKSNP